MTLPTAVVLAATEATEQNVELPLEPWVYPLIAGAIFFALFLCTYAFRNVANKH